MAPDTGSKLIARVDGVVRMKINLDDVNGEQIQCVRAVDLPRGAALLLNAHAVAKLDIISAPLSERGGAASDMREIECIVDLQRLRDSRLIGPDETTFDAIDCVPDALPTHPSDLLASTMLDDEEDDGSFADDPELSLEHAGVCGPRLTSSACFTSANGTRYSSVCTPSTTSRSAGTPRLPLRRHVAFTGQ